MGRQRGAWMTARGVTPAMRGRSLDDISPACEGTIIVRSPRPIRLGGNSPARAMTLRLRAVRKPGDRTTMNAPVIGATLTARFLQWEGRKRERKFSEPVVEGVG